MPKANGSARDFDPPPGFPPGGSVFEYLMGCRQHHGSQPIELHIIRATLRKARVPRELEEDAAQDIRLAWSMNKARTDVFEPEQVLRYAYSIAEHAALHTRRETENVARIPGNGYKKREDGSRYAPEGILAPAVSWELLERFHQTEDALGDQLGGSEQSEQDGLPFDQDALVVEHNESALDQSRVRLLAESECRLTKVQYGILQDLVHQVSIKEILTHWHIREPRLLKELAITSSILGRDISTINIGKNK